jgi:glycosyltransferase involved in cell wall biosynthesis
MSKISGSYQSVLHIGNTAGVGTLLAKGQREQGIESRVLMFNEDPYGFGADSIVSVRPDWEQLPTKVSDLVGLVNKVVEIQSCIQDFDILHFHYRSAIDVPNPFIPRGIDIPLWKIQNKTVVVHFHGSDIRWKGVPEIYRKFADQIIVSSPDLIKWAPENGIWLPRAIDIQSIKPCYPNQNNAKITIVHAPTDREIKGTKHVISAVDSVKQDNKTVELKIIEDVSHKEAVEEYKKADIIVDQVNPEYGLYGMFGIEGMALGKPVCAYIKPEVKNHLPNSPIIQTSPTTLADELSKLISDPYLRNRIGKKGRKFAQSIHSLDAVINQCLGIYDAIA